MSNWKCSRCGKDMPDDIINVEPWERAKIVCPFCDCKIFMKKRVEVIRRVKAI